MAKVILSILAHEDATSLSDMIGNVWKYCPEAMILLYNSGDSPDLGKGLPVIQVTPARRLCYARITPYFLDLFQFLENEAIPYDYVVHLDSDVLFIRPGFEAFLRDAMVEYDYMAPNFRRCTSRKSQWRPFRSLKPELSEWYRFLGFEYTNEGFNVGQVFSRKYVQCLLGCPTYHTLLALVSQNQSYTLHEVLFPTLADYLALQARSYPAELREVIRFRPHHSIASVKRALLLESAFFLHPIKREPDNPARAFILSL